MLGMEWEAVTCRIADLSISEAVMIYSSSASKKEIMKRAIDLQLFHQVRMYEPYLGPQRATAKDPPCPADEVVPPWSQ